MSERRSAPDHDRAADDGDAEDHGTGDPAGGGQDADTVGADPDTEAGTRTPADTETDAASASGDGASPPEAAAEGAGPGAAQDEPPDGTEPPAGGSRGGRPLLVGLALLIALGAAAAAGYLGWRLQRLEQQVASVPDARAAAVEPLARRTELEALEQRVEARLQEAIRAKAEELAAARQEGLAALRERTDTLEQGVREIRELAARDQVGWRLAEIRYLLAVAQRRLLIARDTRSAIAALESADRAIADLGSVRLLPLRQRIVDDLAALRAVRPADVEGTALRLQNLLGRVDGLPVADGDGRADDGGTAAGTTGADGWWGRVTARLDRFVKIRRREAGPAPGRPQPTGELPEADRLVLALEEARRAALAHDPRAYDEALERAGDALETGFATAAENTSRFRSALAELRQRRVVAELPSLESTLDLARRLSARLESEPASPAAGDEAAAAPAETAAGGEAASRAQPPDTSPAADPQGED